MDTLIRHSPPLPRFLITADMPACAPPAPVPYETLPSSGAPLPHAGRVDRGQSVTDERPRERTANGPGFSSPIAPWRPKVAEGTRAARAARQKKAREHSRPLLRRFGERLIGSKACRAVLNISSPAERDQHDAHASMRA